ncbi:DUF3021 domain-containing protein [Halobacillus sp. A5]|uniref:DUF3021 domain-containing protein n=1 Tax=Halobacillus sp. A5 TaxID=2880263 RepID=UPI0020A6BCCB|nr:DUF3021 domain-containing protein [Halobacillus sp. A5]MCP3028531.1 DUF3021 domain-containing protein [Halobacillus sp. A5]
MKTFLFRSMIGIFFGAFVTVITVNGMVYFGGQEMLDGSLFIKNSFGSIFCGWLFSVSPLYFEIRSLRLPMQTALHFGTVMILYFIMALGIGWISLDGQSILLFLGIALVTYTVMWICFYLYFKNVSKKLNDDLECLE